jgi:hypothetical protein
MTTTLSRVDTPVTVSARLRSGRGLGCDAKPGRSLRHTHPEWYFDPRAPGCERWLSALAPGMHTPRVKQLHSSHATTVRSNQSGSVIRFAQFIHLSRSLVTLDMIYCSYKKVSARLTDGCGDTHNLESCNLPPICVIPTHVAHPWQVSSWHAEN